MNTFKLRNAVLVAAIAGALAACGGGDGGVAAVTPTPFTGVVFDGKVTGAKVVCDADNNGTLNGSEVSATSDSSGSFTITGGCSSSIVAYEGTNADTGEPFLGKLKAPASTTNSSFVTPLTTLMKDGGLTAAEIVTALTLPVGTDPTTADPSATGNEEIHAATVAVQQIIQQTASAIVASASGTAAAVTSATTQNLYALVANRVATHIKATPTATTITPLITGNSGTGAAATSTALVNLIVRDSITDVAASTDTNLTATKTALATNNINATSVAALTATAIASQATSFATITTQTALTTQVNNLQSSTTIATVVATFLPVLTTAASTATSTTIANNLSTAAAALATMSTATTVALVDVNTLNTSAAAIAADATTAGTVIANPVDVSTATFAPTNYLAVASDTVSFNGTSYTLANFKSPGVTVLSPVQGSLDTIALTFSVDGTTPFTSTTGAAASTTASLGLEVKGSGTDARVLQMVIDKVDLALSGGQITATIPANAQLYVYGKNTAGLTASVTLTNVAANTITSASNTVSFNAGTVLDAAIARLGTSNSVFSNIRNAKGTFNVKFALTNTDIYTGGASPVPADGASVQVTGTTAIATGKGAAGIVTVH